MTKSQIERNEKIRQGYLDGRTIYDLKKEFGISHERIRQILRKAGVQAVDRGVEAEPEQVRDEFLGVNVSDDTKQALRDLAARRGISMSRLTSDAIEKMLAELQEERKPA